jgi:signal transduction histidine kinase/MFS family permease
VNADARAEAQFQEEVAANLTRNYLSQLVHGMLAMTGFRLVNAPTFVPAYLYMLSGESATVVGLALSAQHFGAFFSSVFGATAIEHRRRIVDLGLRYGWMMRLSVLGLAVVGFLNFSQEYELYAFAFFLCLLGIFSGMQGVLWNVLLTKTIPANRRGMMIGLRNFLGGMTAAGVAYVGGKYLVQTDMLGNGYASTFLLAFLLTSAGLTMLYLVREPEAPSVRPAVSVGERLADIPGMLRGDPAFAMYFWAQTLATLGTLAMPFYILYAGKTLVLSGSVLAMMSLALLASQTAANLIWGALADRLGFKSVFVPSLLLWAGATIALIFSKDQNAILFCFVGIGAGYSGFLIAAQNMVLEFGSRSDLPLRIAMVNSAQSLVQALGPIGGGMLAMAVSFEAVFAAAVLAKLAAAGMLWFYVREPRDKRPRGEVVIDAGEGFEMSLSGDGAAVPPTAANGQRAPVNGANGAKRAKTPMSVRLDDIKWTLISAWVSLLILAIWTGQWMFCFVLGLGITAFGLARLGFVRSLPEPAPATPVATAPITDAPARTTVAKPDYAAADIVRRLPDPAILTDQSGRIVAANDSLEQVFGVAEPRKHLASVIRAPQVLGALDLALAGRGAQRVEFPVVATPDQMFEAYITPIDGEDRTLRAALIVLRDLTKAQRVEQMRADFVANASHELRTPLASLTGFIDTLRGHAKDDPEAQERFLAIMAEQATRMRRLIDDLLWLTRIELNEHVRPAGSVNVGDVIEEVVNAMAPMAQAANMQIDIVEPTSLPNVAGDRDEIFQVLQNLVDNAIKYGRPHSEITVELGTRRAAPGEPGPSPAVYIAVRDRGEGIAREHLPRLTERFYRVDVRRSRAIGGTGLGLAIVKHIISRHRGRLSVESKLGEGSTFTVYLPLATQADANDLPGQGLLTAS